MRNLRGPLEANHGRHCRMDIRTPEDSIPLGFQGREEVQGLDANSNEREPLKLQNDDR